MHINGDVQLPQNSMDRLGSCYCICARPPVHGAMHSRGWHPAPASEQPQCEVVQKQISLLGAQAKRGGLSLP